MLLRLPFFLFVSQPDVRHGNGMVIKTEYRLNRFGILLEHGDRPGVAMKFISFFFEVVEGDAKGGLDLTGWAAQHHGAPRQAGCAFVHGEAVLVGELAEVVKTAWIGRVLLRKFLLADVLANHFFQVKRVLAFHNHRNADVALSVGPACNRSARMCFAFALGKGNPG